ncbi:Rieske 2Fe-2S domain-containing protein [Streptomyces virginiae]|uniref:Rieske 2Fe-2S domain-containing protein n=1 Tax=Streptomyces virginiae TaxID=1961 RepID=UPI0036B5A668
MQHAIDDIEYRLLRRTWFPVARVEDARAGVVGANILGTELVVYTVDGQPTVAQGRCPHRGMALWRGGIRDGCLECPYHGWLFQPEDGRCAEIPSLPTASTPPELALKTYASTVAYGHVWSCLEDPYLPLPTILDYDENQWEFAFGVPRDVGCGMRQMTENFRDMAHFAFVHTASMGPNVRRVVDPYKVERYGCDLGWVLGIDLGGTALDANSALANRQTLAYRLALPMTVYARTTFPDGGRRMVAQLATPITASGNRIRLFWLVGIDHTIAHEHGVAMPEMYQYERQIFEEDIPVVENQWLPEPPLDAHLQAHTRADTASLVYRRTYAELLRIFAAESDPHGKPDLNVREQVAAHPVTRYP